MVKKEESPLFVGITNGEDLRRNLLECSKGILECMKDYEGFKSTREEKIRLIHQLKSEVKEISKLVNSLRANLPKVNETGLKRPEAKRIKEKRPKAVKAEEPKKRTEIERLEAELDYIANKLGSLS